MQEKETDRDHLALQRLFLCACVRVRLQHVLVKLVSCLVRMTAAVVETLPVMWQLVTHNRHVGLKMSLSVHSVTPFSWRL